MSTHEGPRMPALRVDHDHNCWRFFGHRGSFGTHSCFGGGQHYEFNRWTTNADMPRATCRSTDYFMFCAETIHIQSTTRSRRLEEEMRSTRRFWWLQLACQEVQIRLLPSGISAGACGRRRVFTEQRELVLSSMAHAAKVSALGETFVDRIRSAPSWHVTFRVMCQDPSKFESHAKVTRASLCWSRTDERGNGPPGWRVEIR